MKSLRYINLSSCGLDTVPALVGELRSFYVKLLTKNPKDFSGMPLKAKRVSSPFPFLFSFYCTQCVERERGEGGSVFFVVVPLAWRRERCVEER